jgi:hypothetical protein
LDAAVGAEGDRDEIAAIVHRGAEVLTDRRFHVDLIADAR